MPILICVLMMLLAARDGGAQPAAGSMAAGVNAAIGQVYLDEGFPDHAEIGGALRVFVSPRIAVQGELASFRSNVSGLPAEFAYTIYATALRLFGPLDRKVQPYVVGGINIRGGGIGNTATWPYGGVGFRFPVGRRLVSGLEIGGPLLRVSGSLGFTLR